MSIKTSPLQKFSKTEQEQHPQVYYMNFFKILSMLAGFMTPLKIVQNAEFNLL